MKANVIFSGGPDSTAAAIWAVNQGYEVSLITFQFKSEMQYGELLSAMTVAKKLNLPHYIIDYKSPMNFFTGDIHILMHAGTSINYDDKTKPHLLPFGGGMILSFASALSLYNNTSIIIWGATKDDSYNSFEYTGEFADGISSLVEKATKKKFKIIVPFNSNHKPDVLKIFYGREELFANTWSCKEPVRGIIQCGTCKACVARRVSAQMILLKDEYSYHSNDYSHPFSEKEMKDYKSIPEEALSKFGGSQQ